MTTSWSFRVRKKVSGPMLVKRILTLCTIQYKKMKEVM